MPLADEATHELPRGLASTRTGLSTRSKYGTGFQMTEEADQALADFAKHDDDRDKTWTRIIVEKYLSKYKWYFPMRDKTDGPSLSEAYAFYEHVTLPRYFSGESEADTVQRKAEPGESEEETKLFSPWATKASSFLEFGIGVDSYFSSLKMVAVMMLIAGIMNWYNLRYYASEEYSENKQGNIDPFLLGSAICTTFEWVVCSDCESGDWESDTSKDRYGVSADGTILVQRNACDNDLLPIGMVNYATFFLLLITLTLQAFYLRAREVRADEDKLTATDYSLVVRNPPNEFDPDVWRDYFERYAESQVTCVTLAINNETMLRKLIARRVHRNNLRLILPPGTDMDDEDLVLNLIAQLEREKESERKGCLRRLINLCVVPILNIFGMFLPPQKLFDRMVKLTEEIKELQKEEYRVSNVFVTFETEEGQRAALSALTVGKFDVITNNTSNVAPGSVFQGRVLRVEEPAEPNAVRWLDLSSKTRTRIVMRIVNVGITILVVTVAGICVGAARSAVGTALSGVLTSVFNSIIPQIVKILMMFEPHYTEGSYQTSLYLKITLFRWINTAALTKLITPFLGTLTDGDTDVLPTIIAIFWSELFITPALRLVDMFGNLKKHILAPRCRTQEQMNMNFQGTFYNLGERYTDFSKVLFLVFFYAALLPSAFIFGFAILIVQHYVDKYCLMRIWGWSPTLGSQLSKFSRRYFFYGALLAFALVSAYAWAQFPYDNLCDPDSTNGTDFTGVYFNVSLLDHTTLPLVNVTQPSEVVFCDQSWRKFSGFPFPPTSRLQPDDATWMTSSQETLADIYGWSSLGIFVMFFLILFGSSSLRLFFSLFRPTYDPATRTQKIDYSANEEIFAYVPQIKLPSFPFPLIACDVDDLYQNLIGWNDPNKSYDYYNLMFDVPHEGMKRTKMIETNTRGKGQIADHEDFKESSTRASHITVDKSGVEVQEQPRNSIYSIIKHYPPPWLQKILDDENIVDNEVTPEVLEEAVEEHELEMEGKEHETSTQNEREEDPVAEKKQEDEDLLRRQTSDEMDE